MVAVEPLQAVSTGCYHCMNRKGAYIAPRARIRATETFVLGFIARSHTRKIGKVPSVQSATALIAECA